MTEPKKYQPYLGSLLALVGYSLLGLTLFDVVDIIFPPHFLDPVWEFQALGNIIERVPIPLLALGLILYGEKNNAQVKLLSRFCLVLGLIFFLMVPLTISDTLQVKQQNEQQISGQFSQQAMQIQEVKTLINAATTEQELDNIQKRLNIQGSNLNRNPEEFKKQLLGKLAQAENELNPQAEAAKRKMHFELLKKSIKWILTAVIAGVVFIIMWLKTKG